MKRYYQILGLEEGASKQEIQDAYNKLSVELDPKNNDNLDFFKEEFALLQEAYKKITGNTINTDSEPEDIPKIDEATDNNKRDSGTNQVYENDTHVPYIFDRDSAFDIVQKYREADNKGKLGLIRQLNAEKYDNDVFRQALAIIHKPSGSSNTDNKPNKKLSKKSLIIILSIIVAILLFIAISYLIFQNKLENAKAYIVELEKIGFQENEKSKNYWEKKFIKDYPEYETDNSYIDFKYQHNNSTITSDTLVSFIFFKEKLEYISYKKQFFECLYHNYVNSINYLNHYKKSSNDDATYPLPELREFITKKYQINNIEFAYIKSLAGKWDKFQKKEITEIDKKCITCINNYKVNHVTNYLAIEEFKLFVKEYLKNKKLIENENKSIEKSYSSKFRAKTRGMKSSLLNKLNRKIIINPLITTSKDNYTYYGSYEGVGTITYSLSKKVIDFTHFDDLVNEIYADYYSTNSLYNGATPYSYCYGKNPYCSPPSGYAECSFIEVKASSNSDVIVIIKKNNRVYSHAYIKAGGYYKFKLGNGSFQTFFYYGTGWNPKKYIKNANCGNIVGGFVNNESLDKSKIEYLYNSTMSYTLYTVVNGNFTPDPSNKQEAF